MLTMVEYVHQRILTYPKMTCGVDFTLGNGYDTEFLMQHCQEVYAFDIQEAAIETTKSRLGQPPHVHFILDGHQNMERYFQHFDIGIFNLGYLPLNNHKITTQLETTKQAVIKATKLMEQVIFIVVYPGHEEGYRESLWIDEYVKTLDAHEFHVSTYRMMNKKKSPYVIEIEKNKHVNKS
ncbi:MAG: tRNA (mnm(5)s(2)U34)-methyltransferase [Longibaculum sp.]